LNINNIRDIFENRTSRIDGKLHSFSVLIPLMYIDKEPHILFEIRSLNMKTQPGEICFPGGRVECDENTETAAIRETCEELMISPNHIEVIGKSDKVITPFDFIIHPYVGIIKDIRPEDMDFNKDEVHKVITVPLKYFLETKPEQYVISSNLILPDDFPFHMIQNGDKYNWKTGKYPILFYEYEGNIIWGMTARMIRSFVKILQSNEWELIDL
jgi:8-oxo-dGTP pyrophosphatase MutT (NUDIX family)